MDTDGKVTLFSLFSITAISGLWLLSVYAEQFNVTMVDMAFHIGVHIIYMLIFLWLFWGFGQGYRRNATHETFRTPPLFMNPVISEIYHLGFSYMAVVETWDRLEPTNYAWLYTNEDHSIVVELQIIVRETQQYTVSFETFFPDRAVVETNYPDGVATDEGKFRSIGISSSISDAYHFHLRQVGEFTTRHGQPLPADSYETLKILQDSTIQEEIRFLFTRGFVGGLVIVAGFNALVLSIFTAFISVDFMFATHSFLPVIVALLSTVMLYMVYRLGEGKDIRQLKKKEPK